MGTTERLRIIVLGYIVRGPIGGLAWHHLQYVLGLQQLGHDVYFVEDSDDYPRCYDPSRHLTDENPTYGLRFARRVFTAMKLGDRWAYYDAHTSVWRGPCSDKITSICRTADIVLNLSGANPIRRFLTETPVRVFVDTDPVFTQIRHLTDPSARTLAEQHNAFFSFGENLGLKSCSIPDDGFQWYGTRQPIVIDAWPLIPAPKEARFTTVMQWESYSKRNFAGIRYGMKADSFDDFIDLPQHTEETLELGIGGSSAPHGLLRDKGWRTRDSLDVTRDPWTYQKYIQGSKGEFSVAKHGYVLSGSGWFSERSACYLASGRPVVVQDTAFTKWLRVDLGVVAFTDHESALAGISEVSRNYDRHACMARAVAQEYFDSRTVLNRLLDSALEQAREIAHPETILRDHSVS